MKIFKLLAFVGSAFAEDAGPARLVASKTTESKILAQNVDLTFKYKIFNIGQSDALNVNMEDDNFAKDFEIVKGSSSVSLYINYEQNTNLTSIFYSFIILG